MNKKGFTLIELLAIIVVIGLIAVIVTPIVLSAIEDSKKEIAVSSMNGFINSIEMENVTETFSSDSNYIPDGYYYDEELKDLNIEYKGRTPDSGLIIIRDGVVHSGSTVCINGYKAVYDGKVVSSDGKCDGTEYVYESMIMLDVARRYYTVSEIKQFVDILAVNPNSTLHLHLSDDQNVGIELAYLDQTVENAEYNDGVYTNPVTGRNFLSFAQVKEIMDYCEENDVEFIPEIDIPAHMHGFFDLAIHKFGEDYVRAPYNWDDPSLSGIAPGSGDEAGNIDLMSPNAKTFIRNIYDEYTEFFKDCKYFHIGFDEYTYRPELKVPFINEMYEYLNEKGFIVRMWSDPIMKNNISEINNNIEVIYWSYRNDDGYAGVDDLQKYGFDILIGNPHYLFYVPSVLTVEESNFIYTLNNIKDNWTFEEWKYNVDSDLDNRNNLLGGALSVWGEDSAGVSTDIIINQTRELYNMMYSKFK